jgi:hypothetical protein
VSMLSIAQACVVEFPDAANWSFNTEIVMLRHHGVEEHVHVDKEKSYLPF